MFTTGVGIIGVYSFLGFLSALSVVILMYRLGIEKFLGYPAILDASVCLLLTWMLHGSMTGMISAIIGSLMFSAMLSILRRIHGYERLTIVRWRLIWVHHDAPVHSLWVRLWEGVKRVATM